MFSYGMVLYELLSGQRPTLGQHQLQISKKLSKGVRPVLGQAEEVQFHRLQALMMECWDTKPEKVQEDCRCVGGDVRSHSELMKRKELSLASILYLNVANWVLRGNPIKKRYSRWSLPELEYWTPRFFETKNTGSPQFTTVLFSDRLKLRQHWKKSGL